MKLLLLVLWLWLSLSILFYCIILFIILYYIILIIIITLLLKLFIIFSTFYIIIIIIYISIWITFFIIDFFLYLRLYFRQWFFIIIIISKNHYIYFYIKQTSHTRSHLLAVNNCSWAISWPSSYLACQQVQCKWMGINYCITVNSQRGEIGVCGGTNLKYYLLYMCATYYIHTYIYIYSNSLHSNDWLIFLINKQT